MFDLAQLRPILRDLQLPDPTGITELAGGSNRSFRVDLGDGAAVVLKTYDDLRGKLPRREAYAAELLSGLDLPVTSYLALDETLARLPVRFAITNYLPGMAVSTFRDVPDAADLYRQMGALLRRLHSVHLPGFGHFDDHGNVDPVADNASYMRQVAAHAFDRFRHHGADADLTDSLQAIVVRNAAIFAHSGGAVFAHDDLNPNNVLAERDVEGRLRLTGLVDFGNARAADAVFDLAKTLFICEHESPGSSSLIRTGYGPIDHPEPERALWLYTLLHRVVMWWWLRHVGVIADGERHDLIMDLERMAEEDQTRMLL